ncbi:MAG: hypothetical protein FRX49_07104 [Trebouxia sp. A1-2]|nr:MAG: hypothetical protein FRX49_07104 [Trebouxia sp. A1-2]
MAVQSSGASYKDAQLNVGPKIRLEATMPPHASEGKKTSATTRTLLDLPASSPQIRGAADSLYYRQYAFLMINSYDEQKIADIKATLSHSESVLERQGLQRFPERIVHHFKSGEHPDLLADSQQRVWLEVVNTKTGLFEDVLLPEGYILILPGYTLQRATCGIYKAAAHRVTMRGMEGERLAVTFKLRSPDTALLDFHTALTAAGQQLEPRFAGPIRVIELLAMFDEMHPSINNAGSKRSSTGSINRLQNILHNKVCRMVGVIFSSRSSKDAGSDQD